MKRELGSRPFGDLRYTLENYSCIANHAGNVTRRLSGCGVGNFLIIARKLHVLQREQNEGSGIWPQMLIFSSLQVFSSPEGSDAASCSSAS